VAEAPPAVSSDRLKLKAQANQLVDARKLPQARKLLDQLLLDDPNDADTLGLLAQLRVFDGDCAGAVEVSSRALAIDPSDPWLHRVHAVGLQRCGRLDEALHSIRWALHIDPNQVDAHTRAARI
jgi:Flp pilus assembly protein TadD